MLHLVFELTPEAAILERINTGDTVVLLENATLKTLVNSSSGKRIGPFLKTNRVCVMADQLAIRGIQIDELVKGIEVIDYSELVDLTTQHSVIQSWT